MFFKKKNKIGAKGFLCSLTWWLFLSMLFGMMLFGCDVCDIGGPDDGNPDNRVFFTAQPGNTDEPFLYSIKRDGKGTRKLVENSVLFSPPSSNGLMALLGSDTATGKKLLLTCDIEGKKLTKIAEASALFDINMPIMSPDGKKIVFNGGQKRLFLSKFEGSYLFDLLDNKFTVNSVPAFSPDSKLLAYLTSENDKYTLKVANAEQTGSTQIIFSFQIESGIIKERDEISPTWTPGGTSIMLAITEQNREKLMFINIGNASVRKIEIESEVIGTQHASLSASGDFVAVSGKDGNIWAMNINGNEIRYSRITEVFDGEKAVKPTWSNDGKSIIYNLKTQFDKVSYSALIITNLSYEGALVNRETTYILANSAIRGFWQSKGK